MFDVDISTEAVNRALAHLERAGRDLTPVFKDIGEHLTNTTLQRFEDGEGPDGQKWAENSPVTLLGKKGDKPLLGETSMLSTLIHYEAGPGHVTVGSPQEYAAMQQFGGTKEEFPHLWGDIPARPFIGLSADDEQEVLDIVLDHLKRAAGI